MTTANTQFWWMWQLLSDSDPVLGPITQRPWFRVLQPNLWPRFGPYNPNLDPVLVPYSMYTTYSVPSSFLWLLNLLDEGRHLPLHQLPRCTGGPDCSNAETWDYKDWKICHARLSKQHESRVSKAVTTWQKKFLYSNKNFSSKFLLREVMVLILCSGNWQSHDFGKVMGLPLHKIYDIYMTSLNRNNSHHLST
jgi:hypothetical protein